MAKSDKASALLSLIQTEAIEPSAIAPAADPKPARKPVKTAAVPVPQTAKGKTVIGAPGKRTQVFLHDGDRRIIRELVAYFAGQGNRVSESLVIKAALRMAKPGGDLMRAYQEAAAQDRRFKYTA